MNKLHGDLNFQRQKNYLVDAKKLVFCYIKLPEIRAMLLFLAILLAHLNYKTVLFQTVIMFFNVDYLIIPPASLGPPPPRVLGLSE